jgi:hypothetical protein
MEYWIDGYFTPAWTRKSWHSHERGVYVPNHASIHRQVDRIYITEQFAKSILRKGRVFDMTNKNDQFDYRLSKIINVPWVKPVYSGPPTSLPDF